MLAFQKDLQSFEKRNAQVLGVSPDSLETHERFSSEYQLAFPLIADTEGQVRDLYASGRITYLIDREGVIRHIQKGMPDNQKLLEVLDEIN